MKNNAPSLKKRLCLLATVLLLLAALLLCSGCEKAQTIDVALVLAEKHTLNDGAFIQASWQGIEQYCQAHDLVSAYFEPEQRYEGDYHELVNAAVEQGADVIVLPGHLLGKTALAMQQAHPAVSFILIDSVPNNGKDGSDYVEQVGENTYSLLYAEEQAGFLAGYAAVMDGFRKLGFLGGMEVPAVTRFGYGYLQGAEYAAQQLGLEEGDVQVRYTYCGSFIASPTIQTTAVTWYFEGTEIIFSCGGGIVFSVIQAAESQEDKWVIGVDTDQSAESTTVITSAIKMLQSSIYNALADYYAGSFPGGQSQHLGIAVEGVGLAMDSAHFRSFSQADYQAICQTLLQEGLAETLIKDGVPSSEIPLHCVQLLAE